MEIHCILLKFYQQKYSRTEPIGRCGSRSWHFLTNLEVGLVFFDFQFLFKRKLKLTIRFHFIQNSKKKIKKNSILPIKLRRFRVGGDVTILIFGSFQKRKR